MKPIIFSTPMVKAILEGRKNQTRRVINWDKVSKFDIDRDGSLYGFEDGDGDLYDAKEFTQSYARYKVGDILYVREIWQIYELIDVGGIRSARVKFKDGTIGSRWIPLKHDFREHFKWRPSIHMPRVAARIFLRVTDVRVERIQDITEEDCMAEGIYHFCPADCPPCGGSDCTDYIVAYQNLWNKLNANRGYGWGDNPFCWVYEFEKISKEDANA